MLDQSFSADNFRKIFDIENRKGNYLEGEFFPQIERQSQKVKSCTVQLRQLRKDKSSYPPKEYDKLKSNYSMKLDSLKTERDKMLEKALEIVSEEVCSNTFSFGIREVEVGSFKKVYVAEEGAATLFALKQLQYNISRLYKVKQANRHQIVCQLREVLADNLPKLVIRTDISSFYESIPRQPLLKKLSEDPLLTLQSKKLVRRILYEYSQVSGNDRGLPRGIGISAYLAELYMRDIDSIIRKINGVVFYARYVDDIVIIYCPPPNVDKTGLWKEVKNSLNVLGLTENKKKTKVFDLALNPSIKMTYLGYLFNVSSGSVTLQMSREKLQRYKRRIELTFSSYSKRSRTNEGKARKLLKKRLRFLTGNTRLVNNKKNVMSGVFFSNPLLSNVQDLKALDSFLSSKILTVTNIRLKKRLESFSFEYGFLTKQFHKFSAKEISEIVEVWKNAS